MKNNAATPVPATFVRDGQPLEVVILDGNPWFVAKDVCDSLGLTNPTESLRGLDEDEKLTSEVLRSGQIREVNMINESGLYNLIFRSYKAEAKAFRKWVTSEVLPTIRKTGSYSTPPPKGAASSTVKRANASIGGMEVKGVDYEGQRWYDASGVAVALGYDPSMGRHLAKDAGEGNMLQFGARRIVNHPGALAIVQAPRRKRIDQDQANVVFSALWPGMQLPAIPLRLDNASASERPSGIRYYRYTGEQMRAVIAELQKVEIDRDAIMRMLIP